jgi:hypothetical protein
MSYSFDLEKSPRLSWGLAGLFAIIGTIKLLRSVYVGWPAFDRDHRTYAAVLVMLLVWYPGSFVWNLRRGRPVSIPLTIMLAYSVLIVAAAVFTRN